LEGAFQEGDYIVVDITDEGEVIFSKKQ